MAVCYLCSFSYLIFVIKICYYEKQIIENNCPHPKGLPFSEMKNNLSFPSRSLHLSVTPKSTTPDIASFPSQTTGIADSPITHHNNNINTFCNRFTTHATPIANLKSHLIYNIPFIIFINHMFKSRLITKLTCTHIQFQFILY